MESKERVKFSKNSTIYLDRKYKRYEFFRNSHSVKELSEFLASENGES